MKLPAACRLFGYAGYGLSEPTETEWSGHVAEVLKDVGIDAFVNVSNERSSGLPDKTLHGPFGLVYVEFKGKKTPVKANQALTAAKVNAKSFYSRGELRSFVYRAPDRICVVRPDLTEVELTRVDALSQPNCFKTLLCKHIKQIDEGAENSIVTMLADVYGLPKLPDKLWKVKRISKYKTESCTHEVLAPTAELALKMQHGVVPMGSLDKIDGCLFSVEGC